MIGIVDYNAGNITSVERALKSLNIDDEIKSGKCLSTPEILEDGKICYHENWIWDSGEKGTSVIKEI